MGDNPLGVFRRASTAGEGRKYAKVGVGVGVTGNVVGATGILVGDNVVGRGVEGIVVGGFVMTLFSGCHADDGTVVIGTVVITGGIVVMGATGMVVITGCVVAIGATGMVVITGCVVEDGRVGGVVVVAVFEAAAAAFFAASA